MGELKQFLTQARTSLRIMLPRDSSATVIRTHTFVPTCVNDKNPATHSRRQPKTNHPHFQHAPRHQIAAIAIVPRRKGSDWQIHLFTKSSLGSGAGCLRNSTLGRNALSPCTPSKKNKKTTNNNTTPICLFHFLINCSVLACSCKEPWFLELTVLVGAVIQLQILSEIGERALVFCYGQTKIYARREIATEKSLHQQQQKQQHFEDWRLQFSYNRNLKRMMVFSGHANISMLRLQQRNLHNILSLVVILFRNQRREVLALYRQTLLVWRDCRRER